MTTITARRKTLPLTLCTLLASGGALLATETQASATFKIDDTKWVSLGAGLRTSFSSIEDDTASGDNSKDFMLDSIRLYVNGQIHQYIKFTFNTERQETGDGSEDIRTLDAIARFEFNDYANIWAGRLLPPSDRSNLDGPYYLSTWDFPLVQAYPAIYAGRDDGVAFWGQTGGGKFKYQIGAFQGCADGAPCDTGANDSDNLLYAGRLTYNFWDPEPGYYTSSTYYGAKDILAVGLVAMSQNDAVGTAATPSDFFGWNLDALMEKKLGNGGVVTVEGAYYDYDLDDATVTGGLVQGDGWFGLVGYLFPQQVGIGKFQPHFRYESLNQDGVGDTDRWTAGVNYIIDGHNARVSLVYGETQTDPDVGSDSDTNFVKLGVQLQI